MNVNFLGNLERLLRVKSYDSFKRNNMLLVSNEDELIALLDVMHIVPVDIFFCDGSDVCRMVVSDLYQMNWGNHIFAILDVRTYVDLRSEYLHTVKVRGSRFPYHIMIINGSVCLSEPASFVSITKSMHWQFRCIELNSTDTLLERMRAIGRTDQEEQQLYTLWKR